MVQSDTDCLFACLGWGLSIFSCVDVFMSCVLTTNLLDYKINDN